MRFLLSVVLLLFVSLFLSAQVPVTEVRAVWLTTNWQLDWPKDKSSVRVQKEELRNILDRLKRDNFNTVLFQTRVQGRAFYRSQIEPLSPYFNSSDNFDPLAFAIEECHKRGLECHAWLAVFPMGSSPKVTKKNQAAILKSKPNYYKLIDNTWYLDPGRPETKRLLTSIVKEIVTNYDVDGIHLDYIRYPNKSGKFPDTDSYSLYGGNKNLNDWRRSNINNIVYAIYDEVKSIKKWVQVSSSPLGKYRSLSGEYEDWTAYHAVYQDAVDWMKKGKHDLMFPMMYSRNKNFYPYLNDWINNDNGRIIVPGLGVFQLIDSKWEVKDITDQIKYVRGKAQGQAYFRVGNIFSNYKGIEDSIRSYYPFPAKLPPLTWLDKTIPKAPLNLQVYKDDSGMLNIKWDAPDNKEDYTYTVYAAPIDNIDISNPQHILFAGIHTRHYLFRPSEGEYGFYYTVTASDRYHNESIICSSAFYSHSAYGK